MMAMLKLVCGREGGSIYHLDQMPCRLGRGTDCEIHDAFLGFSSVSRHHAEIDLLDGEYVVRDTNSRNGTWVNGSRISAPTRLRTGDLLSIGGVRFDFLQDVPESSDFCYASDPESGSTVSRTLDIGVTAQWEQAAGDDRLQAMVEMLSGLGRSLCVNEVMERALAALLKIFPQADEAFVGLGDPVARPPTLVSVNTRTSTKDRRVHVSRTVVERAARSKQAILSQDALTDPRFDGSESVHDHPIRSFICVPILDTAEDCMGVLQLNNLDPVNPFMEGDLKVLVAVSALIATAIEHSRLHEETLKRQAEEHDLAVARVIQETFLPTKSPELPTYTFDQYYCAARQIGGDYFDYLHLPDGRLGIVVADACGKGIAAAVLISIVSGELKTSLASRLSPARALASVSSRLLGAECDNKFVTLAMVVLDTDSGMIELLNAGHLSPIVRRRNGTVQQLGANSRRLPLGIEEDVMYATETSYLEPGESIIMFSDGVTDAMTDGEECYGLPRLIEKIRLTEAKEARCIVRGVIDDVWDFVGSNPQVDDMCLVCMHRQSD